jgi:hypothetical protein
MAIFRRKENENADHRESGYEDKSRRIYAWSDLIKSFSRIMWVIVIIIVLAALGKMFVFKSGKDDKPREPVKKNTVEKIDWSIVNKAIEKTMLEARKDTEMLAASRLDQWIDKNMIRVDSDFLEWYFSYWTQQKLGLKGLLAQVMNWVDSDNPSAAEKITAEVQEEFTNRVIRPQIAQLELERMIGEVMNYYSSSLRGKLENIPTQYNIKPADWDRYIEDISIMVKNVEANRSTPISLKAIVGLTAGGTLVLAGVLKPIVTKIGSKISARLSTRAAAKMAAKTGGKVAAKTGGKFLGTIISVGIIIWDVWDHFATKKKAKPILRQNIRDYLNEVKQAILHDPDYGIMTIIYQMEQGISKNVKQAT